MKKTGLVALLLVSGIAQAYEAKDIVIRAGAASVQPNDSSSSVVVNEPALGAAEGVEVGVEGDTQFGISFTYMISPKIGVELLAATPFSHDIVADGILAGAGKLGETKHLPPTLSVQFYPMASTSKFQPYVGAGLNYTNFYEEGTTDLLTNSIGAIANIAEPSIPASAVVASSTSMKLDDSFGLALQAGFDYAFTDKFGVNAGIWYVDIDTSADITAEATVGGTPATIKASVDVEIDPWVYMIGLSYKI
jgi:outer membrane protein